MKELSIINAGYLGSTLSDYGNFEEKLRINQPIEAKNFNVKSVYYDDSYSISVILSFANKSVKIPADLGANVSDDIISWMEAICMGYEESMLLLDLEGYYTMLRFYSHFKDIPRFTIISANGKFFDKKKKEIIYHYKTQIVCDIFISKKKFVQQLWNAIQNALKLTPDKDYELINANPPIRNSEIIKRFLEK